MGKLQPHPYGRRPNCSDDSAPVCGSICCTRPADAPDAKRGGSVVTQTNPSCTQSDVKELLIIGAGPHGLSLMLRLLEPDADFLSDAQRHAQAEYRGRQRPDRDVMQHLRKLHRGTRATLRPPSKTAQKQKTKGSVIGCSDCTATSNPPPLSLDEAHRAITVVDKCGGGWMSCWKENFENIGIPKLRSLMNAHCDPFDHRSMEFYAEMKGRGDELVTLPLLKQRTQEFKGPYQVPSTSVFNAFHSLLTRAYGVEDMVSTGIVSSITPTPGDSEPVFEVKVDSGHPDGVSSVGVRVIKCKRVVLAMGPIFKAKNCPWENTLPKSIVDERVLHSHQIVPFLKRIKGNENPPLFCHKEDMDILIVGGGITSAQLALTAAGLFNSATLIQRSKAKARHFDIDNKWMGPGRGKLLQRFWSLNATDRAKMLKEARGGGTIPPEILEVLARTGSRLRLKEEVEIKEVHWVEERLQVFLDDGTVDAYDMIWHATGADNHIDNYSSLSDLQEVLPISTVNGLPVLDKDLSWRAPEDTEEPAWKKTARKRLYCMGCLAGLELGPDALNLVGARAGSVRVAQAIRQDFHIQQQRREP